MKDWTREETIIAFNLYCKIPFKSCRKTHPLICKYAEILGRSPSALNMKIGNIGRLDPDLKEQGIKGLLHGAKMEKEVWDEFYGNPELLAYESERLIAQLTNQSIENSTNIQIDDLPQGREREVLIKQRVNQSFFRSAVLSSYNFRCCISGVSLPQLLEACHIVSWAEEETQRINPKNGLCMNAFFHQAYDKFLIAVTPDSTIRISEKLLSHVENEAFYSYLKGLNKTSILLPSRFFPEKELLEIHYTKYKSVHD